MSETTRMKLDALIRLRDLGVKFGWCNIVDEADDELYNLRKLAPFDDSEKADNTHWLERVIMEIAPRSIKPGGAGSGNLNGHQMHMIFIVGSGDRMCLLFFDWQTSEYYLRRKDPDHAIGRVRKHGLIKGKIERSTPYAVIKAVEESFGG